MAIFLNLTENAFSSLQKINQFPPARVIARRLQKYPKRPSIKLAKSINKTPMATFNLFPS